MNLRKELEKQRKLAIKYQDLWYKGGTFFKDKYHYRDKYYITETIIEHLEKII